MSDVEIGVAVRQCEGNPWLDRLLASLQSVPCGVPNTMVRIEEGALLTKVEKMLRLRRFCDARYLCVLEDDTEVVTPGWLRAMLDVAKQTGAALVGPGEVAAGASAEDIAAHMETGGVARETTNHPGFCLLVDCEVPAATWDVRCQTLSDLWISLATRAAGHRLVLTTGALLRHTKEPWARDGVPPWEQGDRSRFGEGDAYYQRERHNAKRLLEAHLMLDTFGDLARGTLPQELLAAIEPGLSECVVTPGCAGCRRKLAEGERWVMSSRGPLCFPCAGVAEIADPVTGEVA